MRWWRRVPALLILTGVAACQATPDVEPVPPPRTVVYSCCAGLDTERAYRAGERVNLAWTVTEQSGSGRGTPGVVLTATLTGPYPDVEELKAADARGSIGIGIAVYEAPPVQPTGEAGERPISTITIARTAKSGFYNLTHAVTGSGPTTGGATVITVSALPITPTPARS
jgi:hypothetical protein